MKYYYCKRCGKLGEIGILGCPHCPDIIFFTKAKHNVEYYQQIATELYGAGCKFAWKKVLFETEISKKLKAVIDEDASLLMNPYNDEFEEMMKVSYIRQR